MRVLLLAIVELSGTFGSSEGERALSSTMRIYLGWCDILIRGLDLFEQVSPC